MSAADVRAYEGQTVLLHFTDGQVVRARVVHVDLEDHEDIIYDVIEILEPGPHPGEHLKPGATLSAPVAEIEKVTSTQ